VHKSLDMDGAKERSCFKITKTVPLELDWVGSLNTLYYPVMSRLELYSVAADLVQKDPKDITEGSVYYDSCLNFEARSDGTMIFRGYGDQSKEYQTTYLTPAMEQYEFSPKEGPGITGMSYTTLTDNKTFIFSVNCLDEEEQMTWGVVSPLPSLPEDTLKIIYDHAKSLGFKKEYFTEIKYDKCDI